MAIAVSRNFVLGHLGRGLVLFCLRQCFCLGLRRGLRSGTFKSTLAIDVMQLCKFTHVRGHHWEVGENVHQTHRHIDGRTASRGVLLNPVRHRFNDVKKDYKRIGMTG